MNRQPKATAVKQDAKPVLTPKLRFPEFRDVGGWKSNQLNNVCAKITQGGTPDTSKPEYWGGAIRWMTPAEMGKSESSFISSTNRTITELGLSDCSSELLPVNSVILSVRAPIGHLAINTAPMAINQGCKGLIAGKSLDHYFLFYSLAVSKVRLIDLGAGNTFKELSGAALKSFEIPTPSPAEQQKIAECLTSLDEVIAAQSQKINALKTHKKGLMQQLFPREGETLPRLRFPEFQDAPDWEKNQLSQLTIKISDGIHTTPTYEENGEYAFINGNNLVNGGIVVNERTKRVNSHEFNKHKKPLGVNSILISINGTIGNLAFYKGEPVVLGKSACFINIDENLVDRVFIYNLLQTSKVQCIFNSGLTGSTIKNLSLGTIKNMQLLIPALAEQQRIATCLTSLDDLITAQSAKLSSLKTHKKGLMQQLFPSPTEVEA